MGPGSDKKTPGISTEACQPLKQIYTQRQIVFHLSETLFITGKIMPLSNKIISVFKTSSLMINWQMYQTVDNYDHAGQLQTSNSNNKIVNTFVNFTLY